MFVCFRKSPKRRLSIDRFSQLFGRMPTAGCALRTDAPRPGPGALSKLGEKEVWLRRDVHMVHLLKGPSIHQTIF